MKITLKELKGIIKKTIKENMDMGLKASDDDHQTVDQNGPLVYVACGYFDYEGSSVIGVAKSHEGAEAIIEQYKSENMAGYDGYTIDEFHLVD